MTARVPPAAGASNCSCAAAPYETPQVERVEILSTALFAMTDLVGLAASKFDGAPHPAVKADVDGIRNRSGWKATDPKY